MTAREIWLIKCALSTLDLVGPAGLSEDALMSQTAIQSQSLLTRIDKQALMNRLVEKNWIDRFKDPLTETIRWAISDDGKLALGAL